MSNHAQDEPGTATPASPEAAGREAGPGQPSVSGAILDAAAARVREGHLLILPTDTVYGIGTRADDAQAVARVLAAKGRGRQMPPPVLVADTEHVAPLVREIPQAAARLMGALWPGALTIILDAADDLGWDLGDTGGTLALRMPGDATALALLQRTGPMAVTSANHTGEPPATDAATARAAFPGRVTEIAAEQPPALAPSDPEAPIYLLDGGPTPGPTPSTIITLAGEHATRPRLIRAGMIPAEELARVCGLEVEGLPA